jgi:YfiH family protein
MTLPEPDPAFRWNAEPWGHTLRCVPLEAIAQHAFTTKQLRLRVYTPVDGQPGEGVEQPDAWTQAAASVGAGLEQVVRIRQVHGATVRMLRSDRTTATELSTRPDADAQVSNMPGLVLAVQVADCVPILLADSKSKVVGAVHAGWRGTAAGIAPAAVGAMISEFGVDPAHLTVAIGPSIGPCCYTVGPDVVDAFRLVGFPAERLSAWFSETQSAELTLDLWASNRDQMIAAGVRGDHIYTSGLCTKTHRDVFPSYRVGGVAAGRMAGLIAVP